MKKVLAFDLDGTLAPSKSAVPDQICEILGELLFHYHICVISGGKYDQFQNQLLTNIKADAKRLERLHIMPTCGTRYYRFSLKSNKWELIYSEDLSPLEKIKITEVLKDVTKHINIHKVYGEQIEDRGSQISWSALGQDIVEVLGEEGIRLKEQWDSDNKKKLEIRDQAALMLPNYEVRAGGTTTIDITKQGIDKAYGMKKLYEQLKISPEDILFFGDRLQEGGNDYPVRAMGIDSLEVSNWHDTVFALQAILHVS